MNYYCKYCGVKAVSSSSLTAHICRRHPQGENAGHHEPVLLTTPPGKNEQLKEQFKERIRERIEKRLQEAKIEKQIPDLDTHQNSHQILNNIVALAEENNMIRAADRVYASNQADPETAETWDETMAGLVSMAELFPKELEIFQAFYQLLEENADTMEIVANIELRLSEE